MEACISICKIHLDIEIYVMLLFYSYVFWAGDLNFRLNDVSRSKTLELLQEKDYKSLVKSDQVSLRNITLWRTVYFTT